MGAETQWPVLIRSELQQALQKVPVIFCKVTLNF